MISQKAKYAFKALIFLSGRAEATVSIDDIAQSTGAPRKFLEHILLDLKAGGMVASRRGRNGGYGLAKPAGSISIGAVLRAIDGPIAPLSCISVNNYRRCDDCADEATCVVRPLFIDAYYVLLQVMDATTLADTLKPDRMRVKHVFSVL
ncbi:RrF2 family transcriptional regulator [Zavarzinia compransoris]|uniref:Rrf2 family transcriptional regulator n=1 Tax=Zavarzinia compransoris TaxID=1264899 RepID=A0A317E6G8_9PROT|nr:Rrf2 family transcriptional regulator [Zavarzinia compransoris]PWR21840.1 Rrf2 family transcriptional regulator [Zavarzinia compransoris]TDP45358.1 BadM/Rrf2 family transcriptional regulator [Zavarzinia compransoris]